MVPDGHWIAFLDRSGLSVVSPDGKTIRSFEALDTTRETIGW